MRRIYECLENFRESLTCATDTFPEIFNGFFPIDAMNMSTEFEVRITLPVSEIIGTGVPKKAHAHARFSPKF